MLRYSEWNIHREETDSPEEPDRPGHSARRGTRSIVPSTTLTTARSKPGAGQDSPCPKKVHSQSGYRSITLVVASFSLSQ